MKHLGKAMLAKPLLSPASRALLEAVAENTNCGHNDPADCSICRRKAGDLKRAIAREVLADLVAEVLEAGSLISASYIVQFATRRYAPLGGVGR